MYGFRRTRRARRIAALAGLALAAAPAGLWLLIPTYDRPSPRELWRYLVDPRYVVNADVAYELLGIAMGAEDATLARRIALPPGRAIRIWADDLPHARVLRFTAGGQLLVSQSLLGRVTLLEPDRDGDGRSDGARPLLESLNLPAGLALRDGWLYVAEPGGISRVRFDEAAGRLAGALERVLALPETRGHNLRPLRFGPDGWLYTAVGSDCNACVADDPRQGTILRLRPDGSASEVVATGFRNVSDLGWHPRTGALYALEVGRDLAGDDFPPEELDEIVPGGFYGFPWLHGDGLPDPELPPLPPARAAAARGPAHAFAAHSTPLGLLFAPGGPDAAAEALVALHGSWNRSEKVGYAVVALRFAADGRITQHPFARGFARADDVIGRPVHLAGGPDGALYLSDDYAGAVYRISGGDQTTFLNTPFRKSSSETPNFSPKPWRTSMER